MLRIINKATEEVIESGFPNSCTLDEAINMVGYIINDENDPDFDWDGENVIINYQRYYYDDLALESYDPN